MNRLQHAIQLSEAGFRILPADNKRPALWKVGEDKRWKRWQTEPTAPKIRAWFKDRDDLELCAITGPASGWLALDIDSLPARDYWVDLIGTDVLDAAPHARTPKARELGDYIGHFYFPWPETGNVQTQQWHEDGFDWDIKGDRGIVMLPPSYGYNWVRAPWDVPNPPEAPACVLQAPDTAYPGREAGKGQREASDGSVRSMLSHTMGSLGEGGRNNDITRTAGHYAKAFRTRDAYDSQMDLLWFRVEKEGWSSEKGDPYTKAEFDKTRESIWEAERAKPVATLCEANGWLVGYGDELMVQTRHKDGDDTIIGLDHWGDFDIEALGVVTDEDEERVYTIRITPKGKEPSEAILSSRDLADPRRLTSWLSQRGCGVLPPDTIWPRTGTSGERLRRYIEFQDPPAFKVVPHLGWHDPDGFITHEGRITADGFYEFATVRPHPLLKTSKVAPYHYGFDPKWRDVLNEVLTFHDETVCSVFASWMVALTLRPQVRHLVSQFPFMAIQATSGSGKTTGFFSMMLQLFGNAGGQTAPTKAALRDMVAAHQSGCVWVDDLDDPAYLTELLRSATVEGTVVKKGEDNTSQVSARLVAGIVISGENLGMGDQKALLDRAIQINVPDPKGRKSQRPGREGVRQWEDIIELQERSRWDLTRYAGSIAQAILGQVGQVRSIPKLTPSNGGRWADKIAVVRMGARILSEITDDPTHVERVDAWAMHQVDQGDENTLTLRILPEALAMTPRTSKPITLGRGEAAFASPVLVKDGCVWFSTTHLARWWDSVHRGRVEGRVASADALIEQARAMGLGGYQRPMRIDDSERKAKYWRCPQGLSDALLERSEGGPDITARRDPGAVLGGEAQPELALNLQRTGWDDEPSNLPPGYEEDL